MMMSLLRQLSSFLSQLLPTPEPIVVTPEPIIVPTPEPVIEETGNLVTISASLDAAEPDTSGQFIVSLAEAAATETVISYTVGGSAMAGVDYAALPGTITIPAGSLSASIDVAVLDDDYLEGNESVVVTLDCY